MLQASDIVSFVSGFGSGSLKPNMHGPFPGVRGPFTPSQWIELEHQALIYKYINANVPVPSNLLIPIKKSFNPFGLSGSSGGSFPPNSCKLFLFVGVFKEILNRPKKERRGSHSLCSLLF